jgi:predicted LPLAT superfamily acyltransferase
MIFTAHLGNMEIARALSYLAPDIKINVVVFSQNAEKITSCLRRNNPGFSMDSIYLENLDISLAIKLHEKISRGEFIIIAGDRVSVTKPQNALWGNFLGAPALFPTGPFILASLLECPTFFMLCLKENNNLFKITVHEFANRIITDKKHRDEQLQKYIAKYANLLESYCRQYPLQWFNFFDFWKSYAD